jgi:hypothetical protein
MEKIKQMVELIDEYCSFTGLTHFNTKNFEDILDPAIRAAHRVGLHPSLEHGATKAVILIPKCSYVIKLPFDSWCGEDYGECLSMLDRGETEEAHEIWGTLPKDEEKIFDWFCDEFCGAFDCFDEPPSEMSWDYCLTEIELYRKAQEAQCESFLAKTEFYTEIDGQPIYIQERVTAMDTVSSQYSQKEKDNTIKYCRSKHIWCFDTDWITAFLQCYGEEALERLSDFLAEYHIDDLHRGNLGFYGDCPIILDYAGFNN